MCRSSWRVLAALAVLTLAVSACSARDAAQETAETALFTSGQVDIPAGTGSAEVLTGVAATRRVVSLVLDGFTDETRMEALRQGLQGEAENLTLLLTGESAADHPSTVRRIASDGYLVENGGLTGKQSKRTDLRLRHLRRAQALLTDVLGRAPTQFRLLREETGETLPLQLAALCGLTEALAPDLYLNYRSFRTYDDALTFVRAMPRGALVCFKLADELTEEEYGHPIDKLDEEPAIDPPPGLSRGEEEEGLWQAGVDGAMWLVAALKAEGYALLTPEELSKEAPRSLGLARALTAAELARTDPAAYAVPQTDGPLTSAAHTAPGELSGTVLVGDSLMDAVKAAVLRARAADPAALKGIAILQSPLLSAQNALWNVSESSHHPLVGGVKLTVEDALASLHARRVVLLLGRNDLKKRSVDEYLADLETLLCLIREKCPQAELCLVTLPPPAANSSGPDARTLFAADLALCRLALRYDLTVIDAAWNLRDDQGSLRPEYSAPLGSTALLSEAGADALLQALGLQ